MQKKFYFGHPLVFVFYFFFTRHLLIQINTFLFYFSTVFFSTTYTTTFTDTLVPDFSFKLRKKGIFTHLGFLILKRSKH